MTDFLTYPKIQRYTNFSDLIKPGEEVFVTEKIHGSNVRFLWTEKEGFCYGTKNKIVADRYDINHGSLEAKITRLVAETTIEATCQRFPGWILYCEIFGAGIQKGYSYNREKPELVLFDAYDTTNPRFVPPENLLAVANVGALLLAPGKYAGPWDSTLILPLAEDESIFDRNTPSEGLVIRRRPEAKAVFEGGPFNLPRQEARCILKYHNPKFLKEMGHE